MKTIRIKIYKFNELSESAKQKAINDFRDKGIETDFIYSDAENTVNAFCAAFNVKTGRHSWLECSLNHIEDNILNLNGLRLRKYILNNFGSSLYKGKYLNSFFSETEPKIWHPLRSYKKTFSRRENKNGFWITYRSRMFFEKSCNLTGVCYDDDIMQPIYNFLELRTFDGTTFEDLIEECFSSLKNSIEKEIEYRESDEAITEDIEANDYDFLENGNKY